MSVWVVINLVSNKNETKAKRKENLHMRRCRSLGPFVLGAVIVVPITSVCRRGGSRWREASLCSSFYMLYPSVIAHISLATKKKKGR